MQSLILTLVLLAGAWGATSGLFAPPDAPLVNDGGTPQPPKPKN